jgi:hypothetical protein
MCETFTDWMHCAVGLKCAKLPGSIFTYKSDFSLWPLDSRLAVQQIDIPPALYFELLRLALMETIWSFFKAKNIELNSLFKHRVQTLAVRTNAFALLCVHLLSFGHPNCFLLYTLVTQCKNCLALIHPFPYGHPMQKLLFSPYTHLTSFIHAFVHT